MIRGRRHLAAYRRDQGRYLIELRLRDIRQLFNTLDPSPFHTKDLDPAAEEYLVGAMREIGVRPRALLLHVPPGTSDRESDGLVAAIRNYFMYRAWHTSEQLRLMLWRGLISLAIGLLFLVACLSLRQLIETFTAGPGMAVVAEGLLILGWVAMWRPVEIFLYDWWPELGRRRVFTRIARMHVEVRTDREEGAEGSAAAPVEHASRDVRAPAR